jgi:ubiquinone/menaquinone biosynthesis C-methylase UbiE
MSTANTSQMHNYVLGHSPKELDRLTVQARLIDPITRQFLVEAGVAPGMRVLDVGSGAGDVAFLVAGLVGPAGEVVGTDRSAAALATARARASERNLSNVSFREGDPGLLTFERPFDAAVGRYVLMFQDDPVAMLRGLARHVRPGGVIAFHEVDWANVRSHPTVAAYEQCCKWLVETMKRSGANTRMGIELQSAFLAAGIPAPSLRIHAVIGGGSNAHDAVHLKTDLAQILAPQMVRLGVATAEELAIDTLADRIILEMSERNAVIVGCGQVGAWSRV